MTTTQVPPTGVLLISGVSGAGKTTVARLVACQLPRSALIHGDDVHNLIVSGRKHPHEEPADEVEHQMLLRDRNTAALTDNIAEAGFPPVIDDVVVWLPRFERLLAGIKTRPLFMAILAPDSAVIEQRVRLQPQKSVFHLWSHLDDMMRRDMAGIGCWFDSAQQTPADTAAAVIARVWNEGLVAE